MPDINSSQWIALILAALIVVSIGVIIISLFRRRRLIAPFSFVFIVSGTAIGLLYWNSPETLTISVNSEPTSTNEDQATQETDPNESENTEENVEEQTELDSAPNNNEENEESAQKSEASLEYDDATDYELHGNITENQVLVSWEWPPSKQGYMKDIMAHSLEIEYLMNEVWEESSDDPTLLVEKYKDILGIMEDAQSFNPPSGAEELQEFQNRYADVMTQMANVMDGAADQYQTLAETSTQDEEELEELQQERIDADQAIKEFRDYAVENLPSGVSETTLVRLPTAYSKATSKDEILMSKYQTDTIPLD